MGWRGDIRACDVYDIGGGAGRRGTGLRPTAHELRL